MLSGPLRPFRKPLLLQNTSVELRCELYQNLVAVCGEADIPLEKLAKLHPLLAKHCKLGGALPERV